ncbi:Thymocyte nuclear protein 1 [Penicillium canariense]|uniref:Thymocyte nuclear protein 1 n=1 Tax=Penicillium canariense TaxID=189055 RepID=A0A9W9LSQ5_9EURO|nr:Thymocyte nuclear protein 1 [Penicillium canariense]KAJ5175176.1 Thymocyte nuclear protein 1 [Penicillium canariense]
MPPKRKSEGAILAEDSARTPSKRVRNEPPAVVGSGEGASSIHTRASLIVLGQIAETPQTGEKKKRGRPRKFPEGSTPKSSDGPKRGRGRPRKVLSEADLAAAAAAAASPGPKRGRGRPRKELGTATTTPSTTPKKKDGRGRPRKERGSATATPAAAPKKDGRGGPHQSLATNGAESVVKPEAESIISESKSERSPEPTTDSAPIVETGRSYWLMKAEPESRLEKGVDVKFSIDDLAAADEPEPWDGVRNAVARNIMKDMKQGDYAFFYHSNCKVPGVVGVMEVVKEHSVDGSRAPFSFVCHRTQFADNLLSPIESAFDPKHPYYDPKSSRNNPKWVVVHVEFRRKLKKQVTLSDLKTHAQPGKALENLQTIKQSRLSVSSVTPAQWKYILELAGEDPQEST